MVGRSANQNSSKKTIFSPASGVSSFFLTVCRTRVARPDQPAHSHDARVYRKTVALEDIIDRLIRDRQAPFLFDDRYKNCTRKDVLFKAIIRRFFVLNNLN